MTLQQAAKSRVNLFLKWWNLSSLDRSKPHSFILLEACVIGAVSALAAIFFSRGVSYLTAMRTFICTIVSAKIALPIIGAIGGAICGALVKFIAPEITGSGIPQVKAFLKAYPMKLDLRVAISKLFGGIIALGVGLPLGREGPTVQMGAATAAVLGGVGYQSPRHRRQLIAAGAGAGLAAAFNAPLAGVMFVVEELLKEVSSNAIGTALLACFFAGIVARYLGNHSLDVPANSLFPKADFLPITMPFVIILGVLAGIVGSVFNETVMWSCKMHDKLFKDRFVLRVALAGFICGCVIAFLPETFRDFNGIRQLIFEDRSWRFAAVALVTNLLLTALAYGSGSPGGLFAPSLTVGAALGFLLGLVEVDLFPQAAQPATTLALAGMGAVFAAVARVPVTATVIVFEITADFNLLLPLMISSIIAYSVAEKLTPGSIYDRLLELKGIHLNEREDSEDPLSRMLVSEVMRANIESLPADMPMPEALVRFERSRHRGFPVLESGKLVGIITQTDITNKRADIKEGTTVRDLMTPEVIVTSGDETVKNVITILDTHGLGRLPVATKDGEVQGMITRSDIIRLLATASNTTNGKRND
jgi:CIC family chloride channel protein